VENASATPATLTVTPVTNTNFARVFRDGAGGGSLGLTLTVGDAAATMALTGSEANIHTGLTTINGVGIVDFSKTGANAVGGDLTLSNGGRVRFTQSNQIADSATVTVSGVGSSFNGTGINAGSTRVE
jgi:hypothetical protein